MFTPHHVGIVVSDLEAAMKSYTDDWGIASFSLK